MRLTVIRGLAKTATRYVRDGWLVVGIVLATLLMLEYAYRGQGAVRAALRGRPPLVAAGHPYAGEGWWLAWQDRIRGRGRFDPYRTWWGEPDEFATLNVDSAGRRVTIQPSPATDTPRLLYMLGGSTMWGYTARDRYTVPALVAQGLHDLGVTDVLVVNLAQPAYNLTQEAITLLLELRRGATPALAVFLDGNNEIAPSYQGSAAGRVLNQSLFDNRPRGGFWAQLRGWASRSMLVARLRAFGGTDTPPPPTGNASLCPDIATYYRNLVTALEALGSQLGFETVFLWQPLLATSGKVQTAWERSLETPPAYEEMLKVCTRAVDSLMHDRTGSTYMPLHDLFDADTASVFLDPYGHVSEAGNIRIAAAIVERVAPLLTASTGSRR